ncbi:helix-turn-helix domain-containing protein [Dactylosporangium sp. NBC_01737]|uniref:helix-turn-helix domain-containing protein n=1 Tax=Dactylosporangium sp. NBC_01737 TaxID=2975959 RepID=UPI002E111BCF|nr:helix-turn-helix domain-containing protein [Dactylosporangium sp. NBC_01737]
MQDATLRAIPNPAAEPTIKVKRGADILGISLRHAYAAIERGEIPSIRVGRSIVIPTARFLAKYDLAPATTQAVA